MNTMHLFAGGGGGLYADLILGHTPTVAVEWEKAACDVLRARKEEWWPDCEIIETDVRDFDPSRYAGKVDCIAAGWPCQDISGAGPGGGLGGTRSGLFYEVIRIIREIGAVCRLEGKQKPMLFLENSPNVTVSELGRICGALAECGYDLRWMRLRSSDVGADHNRLRWWGLAYPNGFRHTQPGYNWKDTSDTTQDCKRETSRALDAIRRGAVPALCRDHDGVAQGEYQLACLGNGQDPLAAAYAFVMLGGPTEVLNG